MNEWQSVKSRVWIFILFMLMAGGLLVWRWHSLQIERFHYYSQRAEENQLSILPVEPPRGLIYDRDGELLAFNESGYSLQVGSDFAAQVLGKIDVLKKIINIPDHIINNLKKVRKSKVYAGVITLRKRLSEEEAARFLSWQFLFPEIVLETALVRRYPLGDSTSHVIGYVGRLTEDDLTKLRKQKKEQLYRGGKFIGKSGVESVYEDLLRGRLGIQEAQIDAHGRIFGQTIREEPVAGNDVYLTLDIGLQQLAESLLNTESGSVVMMDIHSGELLILASAPRFDVNNFVFGITETKWQRLNTSKQKPLIHRSVYGQYAPGSTIKPFLALAALKNGWRDENYTYFSRGVFTLGGHLFHDWKEGGHGKVDITRSIVRSVNSFYYELGNEIGIDGIHTALGIFGFGEKSGIDLDNEKAGVLPNAQWKRKQYDQPWYPGETISASVGQGYVQVTPLQMAVAMAMIANGGRRLQPYIYRNSPTVSEVSFSDDNLQIVRQALSQVTKPGGTAPAVGRDAVYGIAGKTGTAQVSRLQRNAEGGRIKNDQLPKELRDHAWFVGYAPAQSPRIAVAVIVENSGSGGRIAGPIARQVMDNYMQKYAPDFVTYDETTAAN